MKKTEEHVLKNESSQRRTFCRRREEPHCLITLKLTVETEFRTKNYRVSVSSLCPASCEKYKCFTMDNSQNAYQKTNPGDTPDETSNTGFNETLAHNAYLTDHPENTALATPHNGKTSETCYRTMTEKGFQFHCELKEKSVKAEHKSFYANVTTFHAFLAGTKDRDQIERKLKDIIALAEKTELELNIWLDLVKHTPRSELTVELLSSIKDSIQVVQTAAFNRVLALDKDETLSVSAA